MKKNAIKYGLFLCILGIIVGVLLSVVNAVTAPKIASAEQEKVQTMLSDYSASLYWAEEEPANPDAYSDLQALYVGYLDEAHTTAVCYALKTAGLGYGNGEIVSMVYIEAGIIKKVTNVSASSQTKGVGSVVYEESNLKCYEGKSVSAYAGISSSSHKKGDVDVITGATYTSRGVIDTVIVACNYYTNEVAK